ncbi:hypothetical protein [Subtercola frigoramans]|uniref:Phage holin family protein n=1 Tax=Subtercola frigoramans TaxID=120298 RepID=A0ABS2L7F6_9MICO|nr:hypothetical protein [Subtercola frigoramans]MBM7473035.1 hypothetical protein [Subtercola frigoramans]
MATFRILLIRIAVSLGSACVGLLAAALLITEVTLTWEGFLVTVIVFTVAQSLIVPPVLKATTRNAPAFIGGIGIVATLVSLLIAAVIANGIRISGIRAWILCTLVMWLVTAVGSFLLVRYLKKQGRPAARR